jgi:hypothetical protein
VRRLGGFVEPMVDGAYAVVRTGWRGAATNCCAAFLRGRPLRVDRTAHRSRPLRRRVLCRSSR